MSNFLMVNICRNTSNVEILEMYKVDHLHQDELRLCLVETLTLFQPETSSRN